MQELYDESEVNRMNTVRIKSIELTNVKNVSNGCISFGEFDSSKSDAHLIGIYGQNGSGKTTVINALRLIQRLLAGVPYLINNQANAYNFLPLIQKGKLFSIVKVTFQIIGDDSLVFEVDYSAKITSLGSLDEEITYRDIKESTKLSIGVSFDEEDKSKIFYPDIRNKEFGIPLAKNIDFIIEKELARTEKTSLFFRLNLINNLLPKLSDKKLADIITQLSVFTREHFFIIENSRNALVINHPTFPLALNIFGDNGEQTYTDNRFFDINITEKANYEKLTVATQHINWVLDSIIPGLQVSPTVISETINQFGNPLVQYRLDAKRGDITFPLQLESDGIKKIIGIIANLVVFFNDSSSFLAIDELDSGIFEYLLGEILEVLGLSASGQMLFTSHNLRALEVLDKSSIYFSTTNPDNRFIHLTNVKSSNNLRDFYYRTIQLGGQNEDLYHETQQYQLREALVKAFCK